MGAYKTLMRLGGTTTINRFPFAIYLPVPTSITMSAATGDQPKHYDRHREFFLPGGDLYLLVSTFSCTTAA